MKKLVVLLAIAAIATFTNAATVDWKVNVGSDYKDYSAYVFTSAQSEIISALASTTSTDWAQTLGEAVSSGTLNSRGVWSGFYDGVTDSSLLTIVLVEPSGAFDGSKYYVTDALSVAGKTYSGSDTSPGNVAVGTSNLSVSGVFTAGGTGPIIPDPGTGGEGGVPEPTSGLLLVMGGALLALRRKQK